MIAANITKTLRVVRLARRKIVTRPGDCLLSVRMAVWVVLISILAKLMSLPRVQKIGAFKFRTTSLTSPQEAPVKLGRTIDSLLGIDLFLFRRSCWKRAMVLQRFLALNGVKCQINFGLRKEFDDGKVEGHAWLEYEGRPLLENDAGDYVVTFSLPLKSSSVLHSTEEKLFC